MGKEGIKISISVKPAVTIQHKVEINAILQNSPSETHCLFRCVLTKVSPLI